MALLWVPLIFLSAQAGTAPQSNVVFDGRSFDQWVVEQVLQDGGHDALPVVYGNAALITRSFDGYARERSTRISALSNAIV